MPNRPFKTLFVGDVYAGPGREAFRALTPILIREHGIDLVIVNGENLAGGTGLTRKTADELFEAGASCITSGNHVWRQKEAFDVLEEDKRVLRPANYPTGAPGRDFVRLRIRGCEVAVFNLLGRVFMEPVDSPFQKALSVLNEIGTETKLIFCDFHAEATSEKMAMGWFLAGKVTALIGTHTHIPTSDERILEGHTAYLTDAGMTGSYHSVIGVDKEVILKRFVTNLPERFREAGEDVWYTGVVIEADPVTGKALSIKRIQYRGVEKNGYFIRGEEAGQTDQC
ncbi:TIGR00282 family metallophosphoesterase [Candidatus Mcinerneyibacteriota bacterium]|nr:TIGR00282 family metallophosphoesterase [Candidatus Mcinerneyibacteriota bacterium]